MSKEKLFLQSVQQEQDMSNGNGKRMYVAEYSNGVDNETIFYKIKDKNTIINIPTIINGDCLLKITLNNNQCDPKITIEKDGIIIGHIIISEGIEFNFSEEIEYKKSSDFDKIDGIVLFEK